jgi:putative oxidoreductase
MRSNKSALQRVTNQLSRLSDLPMLFIRLVLAYGFFVTANAHWSDIQAIANWYENNQIAFPIFSAYLSASIEALGAILLFLGLATRIITLPLMVMMLIGIFMIHWGNGFEATKNGVEIPLYYTIMLFTLFIIGPGRISLDQVLKGKKKSPYMY